MKGYCCYQHKLLLSLEFYIFATFLFVLGIGASFFGDILQPQHSGGGSIVPSHPPAMGMASENAGKPAGQTGKLVGGDLDTSLANLTSNLNLGMGQGK